MKTRAFLPIFVGLMVVTVEDGIVLSQRTATTQPNFSPKVLKLKGKQTREGREIVSQATGFPDEISSETAQPIAEMIETRGRVELKRHGQPNYRTATVGDELYMGDLVQVAKGSRAVIRCISNSTTWIVPDDGVPWGVANTCSPRR